MGLKNYLLQELNLTEEELISFLSDAPKKYKVYKIPKRTAGERIIAHPSKELKILQRLVVKNLYSNLPVHSSVFSYRKKMGVKENALQHVKSRYMLKMDLKNFFNSITPEILFEAFKKSNIFVQEDRYFLEKILFWAPNKANLDRVVLSVGAPSSPMISNFIMHDFDLMVAEYCYINELTYTRYADDLTFSTNTKDILFDVPRIIKLLLSKNYQNKILVNNKKTKFSSKAHNRHVTGVTLTNDNKLSIGRSKKRYISSLVHKFKLGVLGEDEVCHLQGLLAFAKHIEPKFHTRLEKKYSLKTMQQLISYG